MEVEEKDRERVEVVEAVAVVVEVGERDREEVGVGVWVVSFEASARAVAPPLLLGTPVREGKEVRVGKGEELSVGAKLEGVAGKVGDNEGEEEVVGVGSGATVAVPVGKGVPVPPPPLLPPLTPPRPVAVPPLIVPLGKPVARGVNERLKVGGIEGEEEEKGEEVEVPHWVPPSKAVPVMAEMRVTLGVGEEALKGEAVGNFTGVPVPPPPSEVLVAHRVMEGEEDWEGSSALCVP